MPSVRIKVAELISSIKPPELYLLNRFIHNNKEERILFDDIISYVQDAPIKNLSLQESEIAHVIYCLPGVSKSNISYYTFPITKISIRFFDFPKAETDPYEWSKINPAYYNFNDTLLTGFKEIINFSDEVLPKIKVKAVAAESFFSTTELINLWDEKLEVKKIETKITLPSTSELISEFKPEIKKISLLNSNELLHETFILDNNKFSLNVSFENTKIRKLGALHISNDYPMMDYKNLYFSNVTTYLHDLYLLDRTTLDIHKKDRSINLLFENEFANLKKYLEPVRELSEELISEILFSFPDYQQEGAKFLFHSPFGLLKSGFELRKDIQAILALKMLFRMRAVKKVLIVTSRFQEANKQWDTISDFKNIWQLNLSLMLNGFANKFYNSPDNIFEDKELANNVIHSVNYDILEESFIKGTFTTDQLISFNCVILDDFSEDILKLDSIKIITKNIQPDYFWLLSDYKNQAVKTKLENFNKKSELNILELKKESSPFYTEHRNNYDYFLDTDNETAAEMEEIYKRGGKTLDDFVQFGNLLRLQPNAFQIIQEIQRKSNFDKSGKGGAKTELLLYHLNKILEHNDNVLIYSQFEKSGLTEIIKILDGIGLKHIAFRQMDSATDIENKLNLCNNHKGKLVYLTNLKPNGIRFKFPKVSHIINFDNWWNPSTRWAIEDKIERNETDLTVVNYYTNSSPETHLFLELSQLGLFDKNITDTISPEKFYYIYDDKYWGNFFGLSYDIFTTRTKDDFTIPNMVELVNKSKLFMRALGYNYITSQASITDNIFNLSGVINETSKSITVTVKCVYSDHLTSELIKSLIFSIEEPGDKIFIITNGKISRSNLLLPENISLIDGDQLKKYLEIFKLN